MTRRLHVLITCEHGGNHIPARYRRWFAGQARLLQSHRGYDPGALALARALAAATGGHMIATTISRLLVELNRSARNPRVISSIVRRAPRAVREEILERVKEVLVEQLGVDEGEITEAASFQEDLDADSLDLVELIMELEDQFGVKISDEDAQGIQTVGQAVDYIAARG